MLNTLNLTLILLVLSVQISVKAFVQCPSNGIQQCSSSLAPYTITNVDNLVISNCVFLGCPQLIISASNVTIQNCTFDTSGVPNNIRYSQGGAINIFSDIYRVRPTKLFINQSVFQNYRASVSDGGVIFIGTALSEPLVILNTTFYNNQAAFDGNGGAIRGLYCPLILRNCVMDSNWANGYGGAISGVGSTTVIERCTISRNGSKFGGAIFKEISDSLIINNSLVKGNTCIGFGGAIDISTSTGVTIFTNTIFSNGEADWYGGVAYFEKVATVRIENCTFNDHYGGHAGGALYFRVVDSATIRNVTFLNCASGASEGGGAIGTNINGNLTFDNCLFSACNSNSGGAVSLQNHESPTFATFTNCKFTGNNCGDRGGAILSDGNSVNLLNCTFTGNYGGTGGTIHAIGPMIQVNIKSSTISNSRASDKGGTISLDGLVSLNIQDTIILNTVSNNAAGAFYLLGPLQSAATFTNMQILGSSSASLGGVIYCDSDASFRCTNCQISNVVSGEGGFLYAEGPTTGVSSLSNSTIQNCVANIAGGFISLSTSFQLTVSNCSFYGATAAVGGAFKVALNSVLTILNSRIRDVTATDTGGLLYSTGNSFFTMTDSTADGVVSYIDATIAYSSTGTINFTRYSLNNLQLLGEGSYFSLEMSNLNMDVLSVLNGPSLFYLKLQSVVNIGRLTSTNCTGSNLDQSLVSCYQGSSLSLGSGSTVSLFQGNVLFALFSKSSVQLSGATFLGNTPSNFGFRVSEGSTLNFMNSRLIGGSVATALSPIYLDAGSTVNCVNSQLTGNYFGGCGTVYVGKKSYFNASNCAISGNSFYSQGFTCNRDSQVLNGFGGGICCDGQVTLSNGAVVSNNSAINGGAMYVGPLASVKVNAGVSISNNRASSSGGAFYFGGAEMQIDSKGVTVTGNTVLGNSSSSSLAYFGGLSDGVITLKSLTNSNLPTSIISGGILVEHPGTALKTLSQGLVSTLPNSVTWTGRASYLKVLNRDEFIANAKALNLSQSLPSIVVATYDYFGNAASFDPSAIVTVQLSEVSQSSPLSGDVIKSILDADTGTLSFDNVQLPLRLPGSYVISVSAVQGTIKALPTNDSSAIGSLNLLPVTFTPCATGLRLVPSVHECFPMIFLSKSFRVGMSVIAFLGFLYSLYCLYKLLQLKEHREMKKIVRNFQLLIAQVSGVCISLLSLIFQIAPVSVLCGVSLWLENIGYALTLFALCLATFEIFFGMRDEKEKKSNNAFFSTKTFDRKGDSTLVSNASEETFKLSPLTLKACGTVSLTSLLVYLSTWTALDPLQFQDIYFPTRKVVLVDKCSTRSPIFFMALQSVKLFIAFLAAYFSFRLERKKSAKAKKSMSLASQMTTDTTKFDNESSSAASGGSDFIQLEESELISICSYNWVVFGPVISLIAEESISDPDTAFFFAKISVLVPSLLTLLIMATSRIYLCNRK